MVTNGHEHIWLFVNSETCVCECGATATPLTWDPDEIGQVDNIVEWDKNAIWYRDYWLPAMRRLENE